MKPRQNGRHFEDDNFKRISCMKITVFLFEFHWNMFPGVKSSIYQNWLRWWIGAYSAPSHIWTNGGLIYWRVYASLGRTQRPRQFFADGIFKLVSFYKIYCHYDDVIMGAMASQISSLTIVCSTVDSGVDQSKHQSSASVAFVRGIHRLPVNSPQMASNAENVSIWWRHHVFRNEVLVTQ